jgi:hypothetical protein
MNKLKVYNYSAITLALSHLNVTINITPYKYMRLIHAALKRAKTLSVKHFQTAVKSVHCK